MKSILDSSWLTLLVLIFPTVTAAQLDSIEAIENYGFWVNELKDGAEAPGIQSLRWRTRAIEIESRMINQKIAELKQNYHQSAQKQQEVEHLLFENRVGDSLPAKVQELDAKSMQLQSELAALAAETESLKRRFEFELQAEEKEKLLAGKQANILQDMMQLKRKELEKTAKMVESGTVPTYATAEIAKELKEIELRIIDNSSQANRQAFIAEEIQSKIAATEFKTSVLKKQLQAIEEHRQAVAASREIVKSLPRLKFEQELTLRMIEKSSLRVLDLELQSIKYQAMLRMVEDQLKQANDSAQDD